MNMDVRTHVLAYNETVGKPTKHDISAEYRQKKSVENGKVTDAMKDIRLDVAA